MTGAADIQRLVAANSGIAWRSVSLDGGFERTLHLCEMESAAAISILKAYQRILRILPPTEEQRAIPLLESGLHSAIQIAGMPQQHFERHWASLFPGEEALGERVYRAALKRRSELLHRHINDIQRNEPHYRAARFK